jgi:hypothetical protein
MQRKIELQRAFAQLLLEHAEASERVLTSESRSGRVPGATELELRG